MAVAGSWRYCLSAYFGTAVSGNLRGDFHGLVGHKTWYADGVV